MLHHLEKVRQRPHHERVNLVFFFAGSVTLLIAIGWLGVLGSRFGTEDSAPQQAETAEESLSAAFSGFEEIFSDLGETIPSSGGSSSSVEDILKQIQGAAESAEEKVPEENETRTEEEIPAALPSDTDEEEPPPMFPDSL